MSWGAERVIAATLLALFSGVPGLFSKGPGRGERAAAGMLLLGAVLALSTAVQVLVTGASFEVTWAWTLPGALSFRVDALAAFFLIPIFLVSTLAAIYGLEYWSEAAHPQSGRRLRLVFGFMVGGLALTVAASSALLFIFGWEVMALAAFVAVGTEDHLEATRKASYLYLVTTRIATLCLFAMFALIHSETGSWALNPLTSISPGKATAVFLLGLLAFGVKAGVMPGHIWLPPAHAAAPSHVSAMMSGVLIKIGIYGLIRMLSLMPTIPIWWGTTLLALGAISGVLGVVFAISQHDLKRLLAYHSVENIGIIVLGVGVATLGRAVGRPELVVLGLAGGLFHVWNHGLFKALLFLSAGSVVHACGTREIDRLGGLARSMPKAAALFLLGAVAISGLPPLNGFASELFVYLGLFGATGIQGHAWPGAALSIGALSLVGGLALACFVKVYGAVFLGVSRSESTAHAHDGGERMTVPMTVLAGLCVVLGVAPVVVSRPVDSAAAAFLHGPTVAIGSLAPLWMLSLMAAVLLTGLGLGAWLLTRRLRASVVASGLTWDCGYSAPTARMQYTSSSFADHIVGFFSWILAPTRHPATIEGVAPAKAHFETHVDDTFVEKIYLPAIHLVTRGFNLLRWLQPGHLHLNVLYIVVILLALLSWAKGVFP